MCIRDRIPSSTSKGTLLTSNLFWPFMLAGGGSKRRACPSWQPTRLPCLPYECCLATRAWTAAAPAIGTRNTRAHGHAHA
eukprot:11403807-Alexandrium_andersonii.AAC.1